MIDKYQAHDDVSSPARKPYPIVPVAVADGNNNLDPKPKAIWIGGAGDLELVFENGQTIVFPGLTAGYILPVRPTHVLSGNTTATTIIALV